MTRILVFFNDPLYVGMLKQIIEPFDAKKYYILKVDQISDTTQDLLVTDYQSLQKLEMAGFETEDFRHIFLIDDVVDDVDNNISYVNNKHFADTLPSLIAAYLQQKKSSVRLEPGKVHEASFEIIQEYMLELGFDKKIIASSKQLHHQIQQNYTEQFLTTLFKRMHQVEGNYLFNHSYFSAVVALAVGREFSWMTYENKEKIYLASMIHDLGIKDRKHLIHENMKKSEVEKLPPEEKEDLFLHGERVAKKLKMIHTVPKEVIHIVEFHHSVFGKESYPRQVYPVDMNLLFVLFILSHEFSIRLFKADFNLDEIPRILDALDEEFVMGSYPQMLSTFRQVLEQVFLKV